MRSPNFSLRPVNKQKFHYVICGLLLFVAAATFVGCAAQDGAGAQQFDPTDPRAFITNSVFFFLTAFFVYWMLILKPSQVREEKQQTFLSNLKKGDSVLIANGILGRVTAIADDHVAVEIAPNVRVRVVRDQIKDPQEFGNQVRDAGAQSDASDSNGKAPNKKKQRLS